jgi:hypothetical protein
MSFDYDQRNSLLCSRGSFDFATQPVKYVMPSDWIKSLFAHPEAASSFIFVAPTEFEKCMQDDDRIATFLQSPFARDPTSFAQLRSFVKGETEYSIGEYAFIKSPTTEPWLAYILGMRDYFLFVSAFH